MRCKLHNPRHASVREGIRVNVFVGHNLPFINNFPGTANDDGSHQTALCGAWFHPSRQGTQELPRA